MTLTLQGNNNSGEALWMESYQKYANTLGPDQFRMLKQCQPLTGMHTHMIEIFEEMRKPLMALSSDTLVTRYKNAHKEFKTYVAYRLKCLQNPDKVTPHDPWFKLSFSSGKNDLRKISFRIQDLLKDSELVAKFKINEGCALIKPDIKQMIVDLPSSFALLGKEDNSAAFIDKFTALKVCISKKKFQQAHEIVTEIQKDLEALLKAFEA